MHLMGATQQKTVTSSSTSHVRGGTASFAFTVFSTLRGVILANKQGLVLVQPTSACLLAKMTPPQCAERLFVKAKARCAASGCGSDSSGAYWRIRRLGLTVFLLASTIWAITPMHASKQINNSGATLRAIDKMRMKSYGAIWEHNLLFRGSYREHDNYGD